MKNNKLILLRHGESEWNFENRFTGWTDVPLTKNGELEAQSAADLIIQSNIQIDLLYTSLLIRAINTMKICLNRMKLNNIKKVYDWRLNERHYGALQGLNKTETAIKYGADQVLIWRRSFDIPPPKLDENDKRHPKLNSLYKNLDKSSLPCSESLKDVVNRFSPLWYKSILPLIESGKNIMIVAHGNSLRALIKILDNISNKEIIKLNIPTGVPLIYELDNNMNPLKNYFLGDQEQISNKIATVANQGKIK